MDNKKQEINIILDILKNQCDLDHLTDEYFEEQVGNPFQEKTFYKCYIRSGATKGVIVLPELNFVIKIPFQGSSYEEYFQEFRYAGANCSDWNYCQKEYENYTLAEEHHLEQFFAKVQKIGDVQNSPIYIQEQVSPMSELFINSSQEDSNKAIEVCSRNGLECFCTDWIAKAIEYYGEDKVEQVLFFIDKNYINDLDERNLGFIQDRPVIMDYSGFNE